MLADRADKVVRQLFTLIFISADRTAPYNLSGFLADDLLRLRLDMLLIVGIGRGGNIAQDIHIRYIRDKKGMGAEIHRLDDLPGNIGVGSSGNDQGSVCRGFAIGKIGKLVDISSRMEAKLLKKLKFRGFA